MPEPITTILYTLIFTGVGSLVLGLLLAPAAYDGDFLDSSFRGFTTALLTVMPAVAVVAGLLLGGIAIATG